MIRRRNLRTRNLKMLIIDEADEMLNQGFKEQIYDIYRYLPPTTQVRRVTMLLMLSGFMGSSRLRFIYVAFSRLMLC